MKKIIIIASFLFIFTSNVFAKTVPGKMPEVLPLFPAPEGVVPNISTNVQASSGPADLLPQNNDQNQPDKSTPNPDQNFASQKKPNIVKWLVLAAIIILFGAISGYVWKQKRKQE